MTNRELFQQIMNYGTFDRMPVIHWTAWAETFVRWHDEGFPKGCNQHEFFNASPQWTGIGANVNLFPSFPEEVIEETEEYRIFKDGAGVIHKDWKNKSSIPQHFDYTLKTAKDWPAFKERLQPDPKRLPEDLDGQIKRADESGLPITFGTASMMGWIRDWMGVENMCYLMYDDPDVYKDMVDTLSNLVCWAMDQVLPRAKELGVTVDMGFGWEDICGKSGPLVSPSIFDQCVAQGYRQIRDSLESYGCHLYGIDSDGLVEPLIPNWLKAGVNVMFPIEPGTWGATPEDIRQKFGKELRIVGGYDKLALEKDKAAIEAELNAHIDLMKEGGFIIMPDHLITPDTPLANYQYYLDLIRKLRF